jgi:hypothetical protein
MRSYVLTTGIIFGLLTAAHLWRIAAENPALARDPLFIAITAVAAALCVWSGVLLRRR